MSELSIFIDESGDFGGYEYHAPYYLITLVLHDQGVDISKEIEHFRQKVIAQGFEHDHAVHTGPLIRREGEYRDMELPARRKLFRYLFDFARICDIRYKTFVFEKRQFGDHDKLVKRMVRELNIFVRNSLERFQSFDHVIVYYDNGQKEMVTIINAVFNTLTEVEVRKVKPQDYCLFQVADLFCTLELIRRKLESPRGLSKSESEFFCGHRKLKKNYFKSIEKKRL